jgi:glycosyltransferase involved in cell wall biosynthesis
MTTPLVSILVITYNHAGFVEEALESLRAQMSATLEVIIIDDASPDGTADVIERWLERTKFPARFVRNTVNQSLCKNLNLGLSLTQGEYVCSLAGDDAYEPDRIAKQVAFFATLPQSVAASYCESIVIDRHGRVKPRPSLREQFGGRPPQGRIFLRLLQDNFLCAPTVMLRRCALTAVGGYDETLSYEDYDMWLRLSHRYEFAYLPEALVRYRILATSFSHAAAGRRRMRASDAKILGRWLEVDLSHAERDAVVDALWRLGRTYLYTAEDALAADTFAKVARFDRRPLRRAGAAALQLGLSRAVLSRAATAYRTLRGRPEPA